MPSLPTILALILAFFAYELGSNSIHGSGRVREMDTALHLELS